MVKQHLEGILTKSLKLLNLWFMKLQVNPMAHKTTPADYMVLTENNNYLIECKETKSNRFDAKRLTQLYDLELFESQGHRFHSYLLLMFWNKRIKNSNVFLIPINEYKILLKVLDKKSINLNDCLKYLYLYSVNYLKGSKLDLSEVIT